MSSPAFDLSVSQPRTLEKPSLAADLVPVPVNTNLPVPLTGNPYERAITVLDATRGRILATTKRKGPDAQQNGFDRTVQRWDSDGRAILGWLGSVIGGVGAPLTFGLNAAALGPVSVGFTAALTAMCATGIALVTSTRRTRAFQARVAKAQLSSHDVEKMLAPYNALPPNERALAYSGVAREMTRIDGALSPKAALTRDKILATPESSADPSLVQRASQCADLIGVIRKSGLDTYRLRDLTKLVDAAEPAERKHLAETLEARLMKGERVTVAGSVDEHRRFYDILMRASRGEPVTPPAPKAAS